MSPKLSVPVTIPSNCNTYGRFIKIWIHVPFQQVDKATGEPKPLLKIMIEKRSMINLVQLLLESSVSLTNKI